MSFVDNKEINMKNKIKLFSIFLALFFTSCIDYVQTINYQNDEYKLYYKLTLIH